MDYPLAVTGLEVFPPVAPRVVPVDGPGSTGGGWSIPKGKLRVEVLKIIPNGRFSANLRCANTIGLWLKGYRLPTKPTFSVERQMLTGITWSVTRPKSFSVALARWSGAPRVYSRVRI